LSRLAGGGSGEQVGGSVGSGVGPGECV
jgi:hypothetical protein